MGVVINFLKGLTERIAKENKSKLYIGGLIITFAVIYQGLGSRRKREPVLP